MDKTATFFRVFDIAFFAPGAVLFAALLRAGYIPESTFTPNLETSRGILLIVLSVAGVYVLGLICHAVQRSIKKAWRLLSENEHQSSWYRRLQGDQVYELATYFWYLRATCWNLAVALSVALLIEGPWVMEEVGVGVLVLSGIILLVFLGYDYDRALDHVVGSNDKSNTE